MAQATPSASIGETDLSKLLRSLTWECAAGEYMFCTAPPGFQLPQGVDPQMVFNERGRGTTYVVLADDVAKLDEVVRSTATLRSKMITLTVHSSLEAVGFIAEISRRLAERSIPCNVVAAYFHDHLFIAPDKVDDVLLTLSEIQRRRE